MFADYSLDEFEDLLSNALGHGDESAGQVPSTKRKRHASRPEPNKRRQRVATHAGWYNRQPLTNAAVNDPRLELATAATRVPLRKENQTQSTAAATNLAGPIQTEPVTTIAASIAPINVVNAPSNAQAAPEPVQAPTPGPHRSSPDPRRRQ
ncbi:MAG: hypothetical protein L6R41_007819 [Letrouitia leprolyta]|nr:MAG: hypothetical protein L6R41_007819 [Letrouitia leprolyta]